MRLQAKGQRLLSCRLRKRLNKQTKNTRPASLVRMQTHPRQQNRCIMRLINTSRTTRLPMNNNSSSNISTTTTPTISTTMLTSNMITISKIIRTITSSRQIKKSPSSQVYRQWMLSMKDGASNAMPKRKNAQTLKSIVKSFQAFMRAMKRMPAISKAPLTI